MQRTGSTYNNVGMGEHTYLYTTVGDREYKYAVGINFFVSPPLHGELLNFTRGHIGKPGSDFPKGKYIVQGREHDGDGNLHLLLEPEVP